MAVDVFDLPPQAGPARDEAILSHIRAGDYSVTWANITSAIPGHQAEFRVFADALKIGGVRINASAYNEQQIADLMSCTLLTPRLADLIWLQRRWTLPPMPIPITSATAAMVAQSKKMDDALKVLGANPSAINGIVSTVGKHWVIDNDLLLHPGKAENFGWHFPGASFGGAKWEPAVTQDPKTSAWMRVIQGRGWAHDSSHVDYSQTVVLVSRLCLVDGQQVDIQRVIQDPALAPLLSHQGALKLLRQPGVPELAPVVSSPCIGPGCPDLVAWRGGSDQAMSPDATRPDLKLLAVAGIAAGLTIGGFFGGLWALGRGRRG